MTTERLERIESDLETLRDILISTARYAESANRGLDRVATHLDQTDTQVAMLSEKVDQLSGRVDEFVFQAQRLFTQQAEASRQTAERLDRLEAIVERLDRNFETRIDRLEAIVENLDRNFEVQQAQSYEFQRTSNAALERIDRILDYLLRQQGNNG